MKTLVTSTARNELLEALAELSRRHPDWRFGQLVANVAGWAHAEVWDVEDESLLMAVRQQLSQMEQKERAAQKC